MLPILDFIPYDIIRAKGHFLLVNTNLEYNKIIQQMAKKINQSYINHAQTHLLTYIIGPRMKFFFLYKKYIFIKVFQIFKFYLCILMMGQLN